MGIRTPDTLLGYTRFPIVLLRPARTSLHARLQLLVRSNQVFYLPCRSNASPHFPPADHLKPKAAPAPTPENQAHHVANDVSATGIWHKRLLRRVSVAETSSATCSNGRNVIRDVPGPYETASTVQSNSLKSVGAHPPPPPYNARPTKRTPLRNGWMVQQPKGGDKPMLLPVYPNAGQRSFRSARATQ